MSWRILYIEESEELTLYLDNVKVKRLLNEFTFPLSDIVLILIDNYKTVLSVKLITMCANMNIPIVLCGDNHHPISIVHPLTGHYAGSKILAEQINWSEEQKMIIWREIIQRKIAKQLFVLKCFSTIEAPQRIIQEYIGHVEMGDVTNREGLAAKVYFRALFGAEFSRNEECVINACLNYGYSIFRAIISKVIVAKGLCPQIGIFHRGAENAFNLSDDILELFRPIVDKVVYENFRNEKIFIREHRITLLKMLDHKIFFEKQHLTIHQVIEKTVDDLISYFRKGVIMSGLDYDPVLYDL